MTYEESILLLGNVAQKLDALASTFLEIKEEEDRKTKRDSRTKKEEKKPSKTEKILAPTKGKKEEKKQLKISEPSKSLQILVKQEKEAKDKGQLNLQEKAPKLSETLTSTERKRWENIGNVVATAFKKIFEGREKAQRTAVAAKGIKDINFAEEEEKLEKAKTSWFTKLLMTLGFLGGFILGFVAEFIRQLRKIFAVAKSFLRFLNEDILKLFKAIRESKLVKFITGIFESLKGKFLNLIKIIRESNTYKFLAKTFEELKTNFIKLFERIRSSKFIKAIENIFENINKRVLTIVETIKNSKFIKTIETILENLNKRFFSIVESIKNFKFKPTITSVFEGINSKIVKTLEELKSFKFKPTPGTILETLNSKFLNVLETVKNSKLGNAVTTIFETLNKKFLSVVETIKNSKFTNFVTGLFDVIKQDLLGALKAIGESKLGKFVTDIFKTLESKFLGINKAVQSVKEFKFLSIFSGIGSFFSKLGQIINIIEKGKGPLLFMEKILKPIPGFLKVIVEGPIRLIFKAVQMGIKFGKLVGRFLIPLVAVIELFSGLFKAFTDTKLSDKSFIQKLTTGILAGLGSFFDIFSIFGLEFFNFDEIRDRIEKIFKPFREGKWLQGIGQILNQVVSWFLAVPGKILGWVVGWFNKDLGKKITDYYRNFDLVEWIKDIIMFIPNIFINLWNKIKSFFGDGEGLISNIFNVVKKIFEYSPIGLLYKGAQKLIEMFNTEGGEGLIPKIIDTVKQVFYATPIGMLIKGAGEIIKYFSEFGLVDGVKKIGEDIKNKFLGIFDFVSNLVSKILNYIKEKVRNIPVVGKYLVSEEKQPTDKGSETTVVKNVTGPVAIEQQVQKPVEFDAESIRESFKPTFESIDMFSQQNPENVYAMEKATGEPKTFAAFKGELEGLNKNSTVNSKIAVDQLREIKNLNGKMQELAQMMLANRTLTVNNVSNRSVNAFLHPSTVNNFRNNYRE